MALNAFGTSYLESILSLVGLSLMVLVAYLFISSRRAGLSHIPGPFLARYTNIWSLYTTWLTSQNYNRVSFHNKLRSQYGDVVRTGPNSVTVFDPAAVTQIYGVRSKLDKGLAYLPFRRSNEKTSLLSILDEKTHSQYRRLVSNAYSLSSLKGYEPYVDEMVNRLVEVFDGHAADHTPLNISLWCHYYCFDVVSKITMGEAIGCLSGQDTLGLIDMVKDFRAYAGVVSQMPWLHQLLRGNPLRPRGKPTPFIRLVSKLVEDRLATPDPEGQRPDLLSHFVATHATYPERMTKAHVALSTAGNMVAGGLSPANTLDELCRYLVNHPNSQERLFNELREAQCAMPAKFDEVKNLPYLEGVVREAYRMHQSTSTNLQRVAGPSGLTLPNGCHLPAGTCVGCPAGAINQDMRAFGADAHVYNPERWMQGKMETTESWESRRKLMDKTELSFGQGSRSCIGKSVASLEIFKVVATLVGQFKASQAVPPQPNPRLPCFLQFELVGEARHHEVFVKVHRREKFLMDI
ncbi:hypothetical protein AYO20_04127 [Fonsecaea nubica]|uniref:Cytochrome P450 n=1 Tax=Fonsecaea nubica TaxID=856822 RepID=A0A178D5M7_9EURO|nr:hypothetical protein AYO20_04127 [Fonsecaea nubica]OAL36511.1 hypothetical protein AYO20_04127 [Fonsecaea nubica]